MPAGEQVALEPALALVLAEHLHHAAVGRDVIVAGQRSRPSDARSVTSKTRCQRFEAVSSGLKMRKLLRRRCSFMTSRRNSPMHARRLGRRSRRARHVDRVVAEVGQPQVAQQQAAVGVRVGAHAPLARRAPARRARARSRPVCVEQLLGPVAPHPLLRAAATCSGLSAISRQRHLVRAQRALDRLAVDHLRPGPALGRAQDDHRPARALREAVRRARRPGCAGSRRRTASSVAAISWCIVAGSSPSTK